MHKGKSEKDGQGQTHKKDLFPAKNHFVYILRMTVIMLATCLLAFGLNYFGIGKENILMLYIVGVLLVAYVTYGYQYGITASVFSLFAFNYLFT